MRRARFAFVFPVFLLLVLFTAGCGSSYSANSNTVTPAALSLSSITPPDGQVAIVYPTQTINVSGGTPPYMATATGLPAGLSLNSNSNGSVLAISGTPTTAQTGVMFIISVKDSSPTQQTVNASYTININIAPAPLSLSPSVLPDGTVGVAYNHTVLAVGGTPPYMFTQTGLPADNLTLTAVSGATSATISGAPSAARTGLAFGVTVKDSSTPQQTATVQYTINIILPPLNVSSITPPDGQVGSVYPTQTINVSGGTPPYMTTVTGLPAGLSFMMNANGSVLTISGTPTTVQSGVMLSISVTDSGNPAQNLNPSYAININPPTLNLSPGVLPDGTVGAAYSQTVSVAGGTSPYTFSEPVLPTDNLTAVSGATSATISGTPTLAQTVSFTVKVTDSTSPTPQTATASYTINIGAAASACFLNGKYAFQFGGGGETYIGSITIASDGSVSGGAVDYKNASPALLQLNDQIIPNTAVTCANGTVANTGTVSFALNTGLQSPSDTQRVLQFAMRTDDTVGFATLNGKIGQIQHQNLPASFWGSYAFGLFGSDPAKDPINQPGTTRYGIVGALCTDSLRRVKYTQADLDDAYTVSTDVALSNALNTVTYSATDSNGRSVMTQWDFTSGPSLNLILYVVNGDKAFVMEATDPVTNPQTLIGAITGVVTSGCRPSNGAFFTNSWLTNTKVNVGAVLDLGGVELVSGSPAFSSKIGVINNVNPGPGTASLTEDVDGGSSSPTLGASVTYSISSQGRGTINYTNGQGNQEEVIAYFDGAGAAYLLQESNNTAGLPNATEVGTLQLQAPGPFSVTSISSGTFALMAPFEAQAPLFPPTVEEVTIDNVARTFTAGALASAAYSVDQATGRGTVAWNNGPLGGNNLIFYIVSPTKIMLTAPPNQVPQVLESLEQ